MIVSTLNQSNFEWKTYVAVSYNLKFPKYQRDWCHLDSPRVEDNWQTPIKMWNRTCSPCIIIDALKTTVFHYLNWHPKNPSDYHNFIVLCIIGCYSECVDRTILHKTTKINDLHFARILLQQYHYPKPFKLMQSNIAKMMFDYVL